jgi:hypothetical protein
MSAQRWTWTTSRTGAILAATTVSALAADQRVNCAFFAMHDDDSVVMWQDARAERIRRIIMFTRTEHAEWALENIAQWLPYGASWHVVAVNDTIPIALDLLTCDDDALYTGSLTEALVARARAAIVSE